MVDINNDASITSEYIRSHLEYDPATGVFRWRQARSRRRVGAIAGGIQFGGYRGIHFGSRVYKAHRLAWLYVYGEWPNGLLDHIDGNRDNNAIANLRIATSAQNAARRPTRRSFGPSRGVFPHGPGFVARIHYAGKRHYLGYFSTAEAARNAYEAKAKEIHGDFAYVELAGSPSTHFAGAMSGALGFGA